MIDASTADEDELRGSATRSRSPARAPCGRTSSTGIVKFGDVDSLGGATIALFDVETARSVLGKTGYDAVAVAAKDGVGEQTLLDAIARDAARLGRGEDRRRAGAGGR